MLKLSDFDYELPPERIAQAPLEPRDASRLLLSRKAGIEDRRFRDVEELLEPGDILVLNDTRVFPARLAGKKPGGGKAELFLVKPLSNPGEWQALVGTNKRVKEGLEIAFGDGFSATVLGREGDSFRVRLETSGEAVMDAVSRAGAMPLPPYITQTDADRDRERYQTVYAREEGAVAAPTAGLHFTPELLARLDKKGVGLARVTLHVGLGTFQPVRTENLDDHVMHHEWFSIDRETADRINAARQAGGNVVAVGTTAVRVLESAADASGRLAETSGETDLFIRPGYRFKGVDRLITNFHLPKSTLLMLVAAFVGKARMERDYAHAIAEKYRFYSYGDAMFLFPSKTVS